MTVEMARVAVRDHVLWIKHVQGSDRLATWLSGVGAGAMVQLEVDGVHGAWRKMRDGPGGRQTNGFQPASGPARDAWHELQARRGSTVTLKAELA